MLESLGQTPKGRGVPSASDAFRWSLGTIAEDTNGPEVVGLEELSSSAAMKMTTATHSRVTRDVDQGWEGGTGLAPSW